MASSMIESWIAESTTLSLQTAYATWALVIATMILAVVGIITSLRSIKVQNKNHEQIVELQSESLAMQHKHNVLSVKPIPLIHCMDYENRLYVLFSNEGPGPLIATSFSIYHQDRPQEKTDTIVDLIPNVDCMYSDFVAANSGDVLLSGNSVYLIDICEDNNNKNWDSTKKGIRQHLSKIIVEVTYTDLYETSYTPYCAVLYHFGRHL